MVDVTISWDHAREPQAVTDQETASLLAFALHRERQDGDWAFGIRFVNDREMRALHERYMNDPSSTDIMTFPYDAEEGERGGDVVISVDTAAENAEEHGWALADELRFLVLHGLLHILGWNDRDDTRRRAMLERQRTLLGEWTQSQAD